MFILSKRVNYNAISLKYLFFKRNKFMLTKMNASETCSLQRPTPILLLNTIKTENEKSQQEKAVKWWQTQFSKEGYSTISILMSLPDDSKDKEPLKTCYEELKQATSELSFFPPLMISSGEIACRISQKFVSNKPVSGLIMLKHEKSIHSYLLNKLYPTSEFEPYFPILIISSSSSCLPNFLNNDCVDHIKLNEEDKNAFNHVIQWMDNIVTDQSIGFWGPITSSVDWCEKNYSLAMVALGLLGVALHHKSLGWKLSFSYLLIVIVGIGSILFHATLQFQHQMWDEVPMVWTACYLMWALMNEHGYNNKLYTIGIAFYCVFATYVTSANKGTTQFFMFQTSFGIVMWSDLYFVLKIYKDVKNKQIIKLFHQGALFLILAISVWLFDSNFCFIFNYIPNPQLHAWWHILMCISLHYFYVACGHESAIREIKGKVEIEYFLNLIPFVHVTMDEKKQQ
ncbi:ceramidase-domain-containing protein [Cokeromyces recurvatus]|uniref:ceramidase-domain-containing protein n=1 Tax=Cokeromyces recurvatus TaxID=90255 RepID=UPI00221EB1EA|nr:ceramidase-domain-containing protein [Cokeromyces recurvatus]KAI7908164.1 ceramidase-domain-containing protein [Cokeromyces recurvatus]